MCLPHSSSFSLFLQHTLIFSDPTLLTNISSPRFLTRPPVLSPLILRDVLPSSLIPIRRQVPRSLTPPVHGSNSILAPAHAIRTLLYLCLPRFQPSPSSYRTIHLENKYLPCPFFIYRSSITVLASVMYVPPCSFDRIHHSPSRLLLVNRF